MQAGSQVPITQAWALFPQPHNHSPLFGQLLDPLWSKVDACSGKVPSYCCALLQMEIGSKGSFLLALRRRPTCVGNCPARSDLSLPNSREERPGRSINQAATGSVPFSRIHAFPVSSYGAMHRRGVTSMLHHHQISMAANRDSTLFRHSLPLYTTLHSHGYLDRQRCDARL